jgi:hypothetical protein
MLASRARKEHARVSAMRRRCAPSNVERMSMVCVCVCVSFGADKTGRHGPYGPSALETRYRSKRVE